MRTSRPVGNVISRRAKFAALSLAGDIEPKRVEAYQQQKADLQEAIEALDRQVKVLKAARKQTKKHITVGELPAAGHHTHAVPVKDILAYPLCKNFRNELCAC